VPAALRFRIWVSKAACATNACIGLFDVASAVRVLCVFRVCRLPPEDCRVFCSSDMPHPQDWHIKSRENTDVNVSGRIGGGQVMQGSTLYANSGTNTFVITHSDLVGVLYPDHVTNATFGGRLISDTIIVNIDIELEYDRTIQGYVASFDLRDPGVYTLQVWLLWYFGKGDRHLSPEPIAVGRPGQYISTCSFRRSLIAGAAPFRVELLPQKETIPVLPRYGDTICRRVTSGRWISLSGPCAPPYCVGDVDAFFSLPDWVCATVLMVLQGYCFSKTCCDDPGWRHKSSLAVGSIRLLHEAVFQT
jgi:hypothetical protein